MTVETEEDQEFGQYETSLTTTSSQTEDSADGYNLGVNGSMTETTTDSGHNEHYDSNPSENVPRQGSRTEVLDIGNSPTATVKFVVSSEGDVVTQACEIHKSFGKIKELLADNLKIPVDSLQILKDGKEITNNVSLNGLGVKPNGSIQVQVKSLNPQKYPLIVKRPPPQLATPDVITVKILQASGYCKDTVVEIENRSIKKPFIGGFRHKQTGKEYHHASVQTVPKLKKYEPGKCFSRDTQTVKLHPVAQQTAQDKATQMEKLGVHISCKGDKIIIPSGKYITAAEIEDHTKEKIVIIQRYVRGWIARMEVAKMHHDIQQRKNWEEQEELRKNQAKEYRIRQEIERRMNPCSKDDFDLVYNALEIWRKDEVNAINLSKSGPERKAALYEVVEKEAQLLSVIEGHKLIAGEKAKDKRVQEFLAKTAAPKSWPGSNGNMTYMDTPHTLQAKEMQDMYNSLSQKNISKDDRLERILLLKHTVKKNDCKLTREIAMLIDREADLLTRRVVYSNLEGLRSRILTLFLQYIHNPDFNPESAKHTKIPRNTKKMQKDISFCPSCCKYLPSDAFTLSANSQETGRCQKCCKIDNDARARQDFGLYRNILRTVRREEEERGKTTSTAFILQECDICYLVENIWNSQSALSSTEGLYDLCLCCWDTFKEWSPWNCVLLTHDEAQAHYKLENYLEAYGPALVQKVKHKHTMAKNYFSRLPNMSDHLHQKPSVDTLCITAKAIHH